jgi:hypothetical protein
MSTPLFPQITSKALKAINSVKNGYNGMESAAAQRPIATGAALIGGTEAYKNRDQLKKAVENQMVRTTVGLHQRTQRVAQSVSNRVTSAQSTWDANHPGGEPPHQP